MNRLGMIHALAGVANAQANCWPMLLISAGCETTLSGKGAFQETVQLPAITPYIKYGARVETIDRIPYRMFLTKERWTSLYILLNTARISSSFLISLLVDIERALRVAKSGRPGAAYVEIPVREANHNISLVFIKPPG